MNMPDVNQPAFDEGSLLAADDFRFFLDAMARPGTVFEIPAQHRAVGKLNSGATMALLALCDHETPVWLDTDLDDEASADFLRFYCGCPLVGDPKSAMFAVLPSRFDRYQQTEFSLGTPAYPDRSTTLILQVETLGETGAFVLSGPGIKTAQSLHAEGLGAGFLNWRASQNKDFPLGIDVILVSNEHLAALPRTTQIKEVT